MVTIFFDLAFRPHFHKQSIGDFVTIGTRVPRYRLVQNLTEAFSLDIFLAVF